MITTYYIISPKGEILFSTGTPSKLRSKRYFLRMPNFKYKSAEVEKEWRRKRRDGFDIKEQPGLFQ